MKNLFLKIKQKFCKHKFKSIGYTFFNPYPAFKNHCYDVLECSKCGLRKTGEHRKLTEQEMEAMADRFEKHLENFKESKYD